MAKKQRYGIYYNELTQPIRVEKWLTYLKRVRVFKKNLLSLGYVSYKESQLIKTVNYFVKLINLVTNFFDTGLLYYSPEKITPDIKTTIINNEIKLVVVEMAPLCNLINNRVTAVNGYHVKIKPKDLANVNRQIYKILLEAINKVLA